MNLRTIALIAGAAAIAGTIAFSLRDRSDAPSAAAGAGERFFPELTAKADTVDGIVITAAGKTASLQRGADGGFVVPELAGYPAKTETVRALLLGLAELTKAEPRTAKPENHAALEVDAPSDAKAHGRQVQVKAGDGVLADIIIGKTGTNLGADRPSVYVRRPAEAQVWLAAGRLTLPADAAGLVDRTILNIRQERVREVVLRPGAKDSYTVARKAWGDRNLEPAPIPAGQKLKSESAANTIAFALEYLDFDAVAPRAAAEAAAKAETLGIWRTFDGYEVTVRGLAQDGKSWILLDLAYAKPTAPLPEGSTGAPLSEEAQLRTPERAEAEIKALQTRLSRWMFQLPPFKLDRLRTPITDLLEPARTSG